MKLKNNKNSSLGLFKWNKLFNLSDNNGESSVRADKTRILEKIRGFTIIELLVAMGVFLIVIAIAIGGFVQALRTERQTMALLNANSNMSLVIEQIDREIRTGYNFCYGGGLMPDCTDNSFSFINANGEQVTYALGNGSNGSDLHTIYRNNQPLTAPDVIINSLNFYYGTCTDPNSPNTGGYCAAGSNRPNFVTFSVSISPQGLQNFKTYLQSSVSSRIL
ncbi:MAG: prepilin-type N-terminal cleavage/methylation domain-containing protein [Patescibacteria group bacterium]|nr:prepilin-type N-terminal cleavage/methylation domain-containing protein [Patescibacteria group bacterium]